MVGVGSSGSGAEGWLLLVLVRGAEECSSVAKQCEVVVGEVEAVVVVHFEELVGQVQM